MNAALVYLLRRRRRNGVRRFLRDLKRPKRAASLLLWVGFLAFVFVTQEMSARRASGPRGAGGSDALFFALAFVLVASVVNGIVQRGLAFAPADVDFLFPGPFSRRELVLFRLRSLYPLVLFPSLFFFLFLGIHAKSPPFALLGILLCQSTGLHLQTVVALLTVHLSDRFFTRLRRGAQVVLALLGAGVAVLVAVSLARRGETGGTLRELAGAPLLRAFFYPASAAARLGSAAGLAEAALPLVGLVLAAGASLALALSIDVHYFEASLHTSDRFAKIFARARRGIASPLPAEGTRVRSVRLPRLAAFRGPGALLWRNLVAARRSYRALVGGLIFIVAFTVPAIVGATSRGRGHGGAPVVVLAALLPFMLQQQFAFDFRRDADHFATLKTLPASPFALAFAQILVPAFLTLLLQAILLAVLVGMHAVRRDFALLAALAYPATTTSCFAVANAAFLLFPPKNPAEGGRAQAGGTVVVSGLGLLISLLPAAGVFFLFLRFAEASLELAVGAAIVAQYGVAALLVAMLGEVFRRFDLSADARA